MKKSLLAAISFLISFSSAFSGTPPGYTIKIIAKGLKPGSSCILACYYGENQYIKDSAKSGEKGEVIFRGSEKWPQGIYLFMTPSKKHFDLIMDENQDMTFETDTLDFIKNMKVKGSDENKFFYEYQTFMQSRQKEILPLQDEYRRLKTTNKDSAKVVQDKINSIDKLVMDYKLNFITAHPSTFVAKLFRAMQETEIPEPPLLPNGKKDTTFAYRYFKAHYFDNIDLTDDRMLRTPIFHTKIRYYMDKLTPQIPDSINVSADYLCSRAQSNPEVFKYLVSWITYNYESSKIMGMDAVFVHMADRYYQTKQATWVDSTQLYKIVNRARELTPLLLGKKTPAVNMPDSTGRYISLYDVKAKYTIVVFWDHGCSHCKKEIPKLAALYDSKLKSEGVEVYAIETEDRPEDWKKFIREYKLNWINVQEPDDYKRALTKKIYDIYSTPVIYLLDENKVIRAKRIDTDQVENVIQLLEKEKLKRK